MKRRPGNRIEGATGCPSWCRPLRPLFHFLDDISYPQSVQCTASGHSQGVVKHFLGSAAGLVGRYYSCCAARQGQNCNMNFHGKINWTLWKDLTPHRSCLLIRILEWCLRVVTGQLTCVIHVSTKPETQMVAHLAANFPGVKHGKSNSAVLSKHAMVAALAVKRGNGKKRYLLFESSQI